MYGRQLCSFWLYRPGDNYDDWSWGEKAVHCAGLAVFWLPIALVVLPPVLACCALAKAASRVGRFLSARLP